MWRIAAACLYVVQDRNRAGHGLVTLAVPDLGDTIAEIEQRGILSGPIEAIVDAGRKAYATDPDDNTITFVEVKRFTALAA